MNPYTPAATNMSLSQCLKDFVTKELGSSQNWSTGVCIKVKKRLEYCVRMMICLATTVELNHLNTQQPSIQDLHRGTWISRLDSICTSLQTRLMDFTSWLETEEATWLENKAAEQKIATDNAAAKKRARTNQLTN